CGNLNCCEESKCNKCGAPSPVGNDGRGSERWWQLHLAGGGHDGGYANNRGERGDNYDREESGGSNRNGSYSGNQGRDDSGYGHGPQVARPSYGGP
ncbi:hypothetical protein HAX54_007562, partial [Datura stramonium]|nr:hypothetical protein [Datura stramonium]